MTVYQRKGVSSSGTSGADPFGFGFMATFDVRVNSSLRSIGGANRAVYTRLPGTGTISKVYLYVGVQSGNISLSIHEDSGSGVSATPGARLATTGSIACPAVGWYEWSLGSALAVDNDWVSLACDNTTATFAFVAQAGGNLAWMRALGYWAGSSMPQPDPASGLNLYAEFPYIVATA